MNIAGLRVARLGDPELDRLHRRAQRADITYDHVGSTIDPDRWPGRRPRTRSLTLGRGEGVFDAAGDALRRWAPQRAIGARVHPADASIEIGVTVLVVLAFGPFEIVAPDRIVAVVDQPDAFGFAYGTLADHPERGEEAFLVRRTHDDVVVATVRVDAGPASLGAHVAAPLVLRFQRAAVGRYLDALYRAVQPACS